MQALPVQFDLIETQNMPRWAGLLISVHGYLASRCEQGFLTIAVYMHYFTPGSLKMRTKVQFVSPEIFADMFGAPEQYSRRWLQPSESPFPGYCRSPGSNVCQPVLCDCEKLTNIWNRIQKSKAAGAALRIIAVV